ncbi:trypsin-like peptidase domain-containing protein [Iamia majanohamensis]|uniref:Trypsin-like peptidase domain-containing protein n=1 Tax=Iamia majanohamensis TaxID=467976 RepID=A0AAF0BXE9_9ACTN|nr:trypsin-like peptidase domain-containing protein [Iamia majanohamensis]WCO68933.1 trypsin-like peptidase domain-containing protein [Iamia majanohamensis]
MVLAAAVVLALLLGGGVVGAALLAGGGDGEAAPPPTSAPEGGMEAAAPTTEPSDTDLVELHGDAVWKVEVAGCGEEGSGSAWAIDAHHLVTNAHVASIDSSPVVRSRGGRAQDGTVVGLSEELDLAVIEVDTAMPATLAWADTGDLAEGERVLGLGYPIPGAFAATPGSLLSFEVEGSERVAVRTDAALDAGNSGGPLLTASGEVAGLVTYLDTEGYQQVAVARTADHLGAAVDEMVAATGEVPVNCSRLEAAPPPVTEPPPIVEPEPEPEPLPEPTLPPIPTLPPTTTVPCPTGAPTVTVDAADAVQESPEYSPEWWSISVRGTVRNDTSASITVGMVDITVDGVPGTHLGFVDAFELRPGEASPFSADLYVDSASPPGGASATMNGWGWADWDFSDCGTA